MNAPAATLSPDRSGLVDAWRALACLAVVLFHGTETCTAADHPLVILAAKLGRFGWLGVPVFFVISGYCLARTIERRAARNLGPLAFWQDRLLRIYPAYWAALLLAFALALVATPFNHLPPASAFPATPLSWLGNLSLTTSWLGLSPQLIVSWSLDHEIGFYVLVGFALLTPAADPLRRLGVYAAITLLALLPAVSSWVPPLSFWPQFACGIAVHAILDPALPRLARALSGLALILFAAFLLARHGVAAAFAPLAALVFLATLATEARLPRPPRALVAIGFASYSIYLLHVPFMSPVLNLARRLLAPSGSAFAAVWLGHLALGVAAGLVFHQLVEKRGERLRSRLARA